MPISCPPVVLGDANFSCIPLCLDLLGRGHRLAVCGNLATDPCHHHAQASLAIDYSDRSLLLETVKGIGASYLVAGCNDVSYLSCAYVAEQLALPGYDAYETALLLHEKDRFRAFAQRGGYPIPKLFDVSSGADRIQFPVLVKPADSFSGRGIEKIDEAPRLAAALDTARSFSRTDTAVVEQFVEGSLHSHSAFVRDGRIVMDFFVDEFCTVYAYQVNSSCLSTTLSAALRREVRACIEQLVSELKLCDGLLHTQFIAKDERFWLIELTRRCPGDLYSQLIRYSTGIDYAACYVSGFLGAPISERNNPADIRHFSRHTVSTSQPGYLFGLRHDIPADEVQILQLKKCGDRLGEAPYDKAAIFFAEFSSEEEKTRITPILRDLIILDMLPQSSPDRGSES